MWFVAVGIFIAGMIAVIVANGDVAQNLLSVGASPVPDYRSCASSVLTIDVFRGASYVGAYVGHLSGGELTQGPFRSTTDTIML
jgi:hypothetical protein